MGGNDCFANLSGRLVVSSWITVKDGVERYADGNGYLCKDVIRENGTILKTAGADGWQVASGWVNVANQRFMLSPERASFIVDGCRLMAIGIGLMPILVR